MDKILRIYPAYFDVTNPEFEHALFGVNVCDEDLTLTYNSRAYLVKPGQIFETDDPIANILLQQGYTYEFVEIRNASGRSTTGEKINEQQRLEFFQTYDEAQARAEALLPETKSKAYTEASIARLGTVGLRKIIDGLGLDQPPEGTVLADLRSYILAEQA